jgi:hypothetical protein
MKLNNIKPGDRLCWIHTRAREFEELVRYPEQVKREIIVQRVFEDYVKTDFGSYFLSDGRSVDAPCGCKRFCECYGRVEPIK